MFSRQPRSRVSEWLSRYQEFGLDGVLKGYRSGRPSALTPQPRTQPGDTLDSGPVAYGLDHGVWTTPMIPWVVAEEFGVHYHPEHVRQLLHGLGRSVQRPQRVMARVDAEEQDRWHRRTYHSLKNGPIRKTGR